MDKPEQILTSLLQEQVVEASSIVFELQRLEATVGELNLAIAALHAASLNKSEPQAHQPDSSEGQLLLQESIQQVFSGIADIHSSLQNGLLEISLFVGSARSNHESCTESDYHSTSELRDGSDINLLYEAVPPALIDPDERDGLIRSVKRRQRIPHLKLKWEAFCAENGSRRFDPALHESSFLQSFVDTHGEHEGAQGARSSRSRAPFKDSDITPLYPRRPR